MATLDEELSLPDGLFKVTHVCEDPLADFIHVSQKIPSEFGTRLFAIPASLWNEAHKVPELEATLELTRMDADEAVHDRDELRKFFGEEKAIEALQDRIRDLERQLDDHKKHYPENYLWFCLDADERTMYVEWRDRMDREHPADDGAIGGRYSIVFSPTSLGTMAKGFDSFTKEEISLTDTSQW